MRLLVLTSALMFLTGCDGGEAGDYPHINVKWRRETPPRRSEYSTVVFSRQVDGTWRDCFSVSGTHLDVSFEAGTSPDNPKFVLSTAADRVVLEVLPETKTKQGIAARNLGLTIASRGSSEVQELPEGQTRSF